MLNDSLIHIAPAIKRQFRMLNYGFNDQGFEVMLFAVASYIFSTWNVELQLALGKSQSMKTDKDIDDFGDVDLF
jgi:hypothetical protein